MDAQAQRLGLMVRLAAAFPEANVTKATVTLYATELGRLENQDVLGKVVQNHVLNGKKWPALADLRTDYRHELERVPAKHDSLPIGRPPIPKEYFAAKERLFGKMDARADELEPPS